MRPAIDHAPHQPAPPTEAELSDAARVIASQQSTTPNLVFLRDKSLLFNEARDGFVMYAVQGRSWIVMGDPVGPDDAVPGLIRQFLERCDDYGGIPVFYEVGPGTCTTTPMPASPSSGSARTRAWISRPSPWRGEGHRGSARPCAGSNGPARVSRGSFGACPTLLPELTRVSEEWLPHKTTAEKGFSLGFFDDAYVARFPVASSSGADGCPLRQYLAGHRGGRTLGGPDALCRDAPRVVMEALVATYALGPAAGLPLVLAGHGPALRVRGFAVASLWNRLAFIYRHGERLRLSGPSRFYKEHFDPVWDPRYLAYPGGLRCRACSPTSALIAGGYRRIFQK